MSSAGVEVEALLAPISPERPCGESLEDLPPLVTLDAMRLFGQSRSLDAAAGGDDTRKPPDWGEVRALSLEGLAKSRDLRLLSYLATAALRTDGLAAFFDTFPVAAGWLETYWQEVHPVLDEDAIARRNALNCFADPMAVLDRLRRVPVVESRQHGRFSLRDIDIAKGTLAPGPTDTPSEMAQIDAALGEMPLETLKRLTDGVTTALASVGRIDAKMRGEGGTEVAPSFEQLSTLLARLQVVLQAQVTARGEADAAAIRDGGPGGEHGTPTKAVPVGTVGSRQDAIRALDAVSEYFRRHEPSSPVPLLLDRAKRLVSKDFLEVLEDIAPDALSSVRALGGLRNE